MWRVNYAPTAGPGPDGRPLRLRVGARTTVDVVNRPNAGRLLAGNQTWRARPRGEPRAALLVVETLDANARRETFLPLLLRNPDKEVFLLNPAMAHAFRYAFGALKQAIERDPRHRGAAFKDKPMTGWTALMAALQLCGQVSLYGFTPFRGLPGERYRYFDAQEASLRVHSFDLAMEAIDLLAEQLPLRVVRPGGGGDNGSQPLRQ